MRVKIADGNDARVAILKVGAKGEGVVRDSVETAYIPFTLPGEIVRATMQGTRGTLTEIEQPSPDRIAPVCQHFGICGGCAVQHWRNDPYAEWKMGLIRVALDRADVPYPAFELKQYPIASRRRITVSAMKNGSAIYLGYRAAKSHTMVNIAVCPILTPKLEAVLPKLRLALPALFRANGELRFHLTHADNGLDCVVETESKDRKALPAAAQALQTCGFIRAVWNDTLLFQHAAPVLKLSNVTVELPPLAFIQAVAACEADMAAFAVNTIAASVNRRGSVCDLFAGIGALTFPLAKHAAVTACELSEAAINTMQAAARHAQGLRPIKAIQRDLFRNPLGLLELKPFESVIFDPPYQGAEAQARALSASAVETVVAMSCNPVTFARDAAILVAGDYEIETMAAFDQFRFSAHVEVAAVFRRARASTRVMRIP